MPSITLRHISKSFAAVPALSDVSLSLLPGRVHGVLGENGAGKSTLMNVLYGLLRPDSGQVLLDDTSVTFRSPSDALRAGVGMVHQHFMLAGAMTVLDNVLLGDRRQRQWLNRRAAAQHLRDLSRRLNLEIDPNALAEHLSVGQQQRVEIIKALYRDVTTLILDEPTAVLTPGETDQLLDAIARLRAEGKSVVFISHKLSEVMRICDDVTVLRRGRVVWSGERRDTTPEQLAAHMIGEARQAASLPSPGTPGEGRVRAGAPQPRASHSPILILNNLSAPGLSPLSLTLHDEILGVAGVDGNGQQELAELLVGLRRAHSGSIHLNNLDITHVPLTRRTDFGVVHIPNDRKLEGLVLSMSLPDNLALKHHRREPFSRFGFLTRRASRPLADTLRRHFDVRTATLDAPVSTLSGGNQQKVILARELAVVPPKLIVAINPTRGLDLKATDFVHHELLRQRDAGCAVLLISSELDELLKLSDRLAVLYKGNLTLTDFPHEPVERIGQRMAGINV